MKKGILLFAVQGTFDYVSLAIKAVKKIKRITDIPVSVVTNDSKLIPMGLFDNIIIVSDNNEQKKRFYNGAEFNEFHSWKNFTRCMSYDLTPYDHTLVIDVDYVLNSDFLIKCFEIDKDFLIFKDSIDIAEWRSNYEFRYINQFSIPFYWATVFMFKKNEKMNHFFKILKEIRNSWDYYRCIYQIKESTFRNDFAFSIAIHIFFGSTPNNFVDTFPGKMYYTLDKDHLIKADSNKMIFNLHQDHSANYVPCYLSDIDIHVMNKFDLLRVEI